MILSSITSISNLIYVQDWRILQWELPPEQCENSICTPLLSVNFFYTSHIWENFPQKFCNLCKQLQSHPHTQAFFKPNHISCRRAFHFMLTHNQQGLRLAARVAGTGTDKSDVLFSSSSEKQSDSDTLQLSTWAELGNQLSKRKQWRTELSSHPRKTYFKVTVRQPRGRGAKELASASLPSFSHLELCFTCTLSH